MVEDLIERKPITVKIDPLTHRVSIRETNAQILGQATWSVLSYMATRPQTLLPSSEIRDIATANGLTTKQPAGQAIRNLRVQLEEDPKNPQLILSQGPPKGTQYMLNAQVDWIHENPPSEHTLTSLPSKPKFTVNLTTQEVQVDNAVYQMRGGAAWEIFKYLAYHPRQKLSSEALLQIAQDNGATSPTVLRNIMIYFRRTFGTKLSNTRFLKRFGTGDKTKYYLDADIEITSDSERMESKFNIALPDGKIFKTDGKLRAQALSRLLQTSKDSPISSKELAEVIYGDLPYPSVSGKLSAFLSLLNDGLYSLGWQVVRIKERGELTCYLDQLKKDKLSLPDGQIPPKLSRIQGMLLKSISHIPEKAISTSELIRVVYGNGKERNHDLRSTILGTLKDLRKKIGETGWTIITLYNPVLDQEASHYLELQEAVKTKIQAQEKFGQLYEQYENSIFRIANRKLGNSEDAQEIVQKTFLNAWQHWPFTPKQGIPYDKAVAGWLFRIAHNLIVDTIRHKVKHLSSSIDNETGYIPLPDKNTYNNPEEMAEIKSDMGQLGPAILKLSPSQREVIKLRYIDQLSISEIASQTDRKEGTVKVLLHKGRERLRDLLQVTE